VDAGFEGDNHFVLVEAKNFAVDDFMVRQLYYPYRLWSRKLSKRVVPVLMTFSNDVFNFFVYDFPDQNAYSSLRLLCRRSYTIAPDDITRDDVNALLTQIRLVPEPDGIPFPQADSFDRVVDLMTALYDQGVLTRDDITANYAFDARQTDYYVAAGRYLGLVERHTDQDDETVYTLTDKARTLMKQRHKVRYIGLIHKVLEHPVFYRTFVASTHGGSIPGPDAISEIMVECNIRLNEVTRHRRAGSVRGWVKWIWDQMTD
jgi:hypothetical protein